MVSVFLTIPWLVHLPYSWFDNCVLLSDMCCSCPELLFTFPITVCPYGSSPLYILSSLRQQSNSHVFFVCVLLNILHGVLYLVFPVHNKCVKNVNQIFKWMWQSWVAYEEFQVCPEWSGQRDWLLIGMEMFSSQAVIHCELMVNGTQVQDGYPSFVSLGGHILCQLKPFKPIFEKTLGSLG